MSSNLKVNTILPSTGTTVAVSGIVSATSSVSIGSSCTATTFYGSGANLTSLPSQVTISNNADNRVITGGSGTNLNGESLLTFDGNKLLVASNSYNILEMRADENNDGGNDDSILNFTHDGTLRAEIRYDESDSKLELATSDNGGHLTIDSNGNITIGSGNLVIGTSGKGIDFSAASHASGMTSELLDDYEEGSFSPTLVNGNNGYRFQNGTYTKIGNLVTFTAYIETSSTPPSGNLAFGNLPYASIGARSWVFPFHTNRTSFGTNSFDARAYMGGSDTNIYIYYPVNSSSSNFQPINQNGMNAANASAVWISGSYQTAS